MKTPNQITTIKNHLVSSVIQVFGYSLTVYNINPNLFKTCLRKVSWRTEGTIYACCDISYGTVRKL